MFENWTVEVKTRKTNDPRTGYVNIHQEGTLLYQGKPVHTLRGSGVQALRAQAAQWNEQGYTPTLEQPKCRGDVGKGKTRKWDMGPLFTKQK